MDNIYNKLNSIELLYIELNKKYDKINFSLNFNKINKDNKEDENINTIISYGSKNNINDNYENQMKEIFED